MDIVLALLIVCCLISLLTPVVWVATFNVLGLKRISQRLEMNEEDIDALVKKSKSLQTQVRQTRRRETEPDPDAEIAAINADIQRMMGNGGDPNPVKVPPRGGIKDAN